MNYDKRLEHIRDLAGIRSIRDFYQRLVSETGYEGSYASVRAYHRGERQPPAEYFVQVWKLTEARLEWLLTGEEPIFAPPKPGALMKLLEAGSVDATGSPLAEFLKETDDPFWRKLPGTHDYAPIVRQLLRELTRRWRAAAGPDGDPSAEDLGRIGHEVDRLLQLPYELFGFEKHPSSREFTDYALAMLHGLLLIAPEEGAGLARRELLETGAQAE